MQERKLRHQLAKWYEVSRLRARFYTQHDMSQQHKDELRSLSYKLTRRVEIPSRQLIQQKISYLNDALRTCENNSRQANLSKWRQQMRNGSGFVSKWIKRKTQVFCSSVIDQKNQPTTTWHGAAASIHDFWTSFWAEHAGSIPDLPSRTDSLLDGVRVLEIPVNIKFPTGVQL